MQNDLPMTTNRSKSKPEVQFQHGGRPYSETGSLQIQLSRSFIERIFLNSVPFDIMPLQIYRINLHWKLGLGLGLDSGLHYFSIFTDNKENEHLIIRECHGR